MHSWGVGGLNVYRHIFNYDTLYKVECASCLPVCGRNSRRFTPQDSNLDEVFPRGQSAEGAQRPTVGGAALGAQPQRAGGGGRGGCPGAAAQLPQSQKEKKRQKKNATKGNSFSVLAARPTMGPTSTCASASREGRPQAWVAESETSALF